jgi:hypothetical protein
LFQCQQWLRHPPTWRGRRRGKPVWLQCVLHMFNKLLRDPRRSRCLSASHTSFRLRSPVFRLLRVASECIAAQAHVNFQTSFQIVLSSSLEHLASFGYRDTRVQQSSAESTHHRLRPFSCMLSPCIPTALCYDVELALAHSRHTRVYCSGLVQMGGCHHRFDAFTMHKLKADATFSDVTQASFPVSEGMSVTS